MVRRRYLHLQFSDHDLRVLSLLPVSEFDGPFDRRRKTERSEASKDPVTSTGPSPPPRAPNAPSSSSSSRSSTPLPTPGSHSRDDPQRTQPTHQTDQHNVHFDPALDELHDTEKHARHKKWKKRGMNIVVAMVIAGEVLLVASAIVAPLVTYFVVLAPVL